MPAEARPGCQRGLLVEAGPGARSVDCGPGCQRWEQAQAARAQLEEWQHDRRLEREALRLESAEEEGRAVRSAERKARRHGTAFWQAAHQERECANEYCRNRFIPARITGRYCSEKCRVLSHRRRRMTRDIGSDD